MGYPCNPVTMGFVGASGSPPSPPIPTPHMLAPRSFAANPGASCSSFCTEFVAGLVQWLQLSEAVLPTMTAFATGLGGEGTDEFVQILMKDPILKKDPMVLTQVCPSLGEKRWEGCRKSQIKPSLTCKVSSKISTVCGGEVEN